MFSVCQGLWTGMSTSSSCQSTKNSFLFNWKKSETEIWCPPEFRDWSFCSSPALAKEIHSWSTHGYMMWQTSNIQTFICTVPFATGYSIISRSFYGWGNFQQIVKLRAEDNADFAYYLMRTPYFTSPKSQEEIMRLFNYEIFSELPKEIRKNGHFAVMVDGTQDNFGNEQESICVLKTCGFWLEDTWDTCNNRGSDSTYVIWCYNSTLAP